MRELQNAENDSLIVLPEYSNAGGISDAESEKAALPRAEKLLKFAATTAKEKSAYVAINVLEERNQEIKNSTYLFDKMGNAFFVYDKIHLPPSEISLGVKYGDGACVCDLFFVFVSARTQHRLTACGQHHFSHCENIIVLFRTQNDVMANAINDVMFCVNDVGSRPTLRLDLFLL